MKNTILICLIGLTLVWSGCRTTPETESAHLGEIRFDITGSEAAIPYFHEGMLLLHSFEYSDAKESFVKAQEADPSCAMAYWGEAMTYNHNLWNQQDYEEGKDALRRMDSLAGNTSLSALEADFIEAARILYGEGDKIERDQKYADFMGEMYEEYKGNHEVGALYALSLLGSVSVGRDVAVYEKGAKIAKGILSENPNHPGALHYLIHSYDDPDHAYLALEAANSYSKVAPDATHALHMPSHIYVAMGMWDEVISSNIASYGASVKKMEAENLGNDGRSYHAFSWLMYGYLNKGNFDEAERMLVDMTTYTTEEPSRQARGYFIDMTGAQLVALDNWDNKWAEFEIEFEDMNISSIAQVRFIKGMQVASQGNQQLLEEIIEKMELERMQKELSIDERGISVCGALAPPNANKLDIGMAQVMEMELRARLGQMQDDAEETEEWLKKATELESTLSYSFGPPVIAKPSWEMYGEWLLSQNRAEEAVMQFEKALEHGPGRLRGLTGIRDAFLQSGKSAEADSVNQIILKNTSETKSLKEV